MKNLRHYYFFLAMFFLLPTIGNAVVDESKIEKPVNAESTSEAADIINLTNKQLEAKLGRKLKLKEKIALKIIKRKLKKQADKDPENLETEPRAVLGFIFSVASFVTSLIFLISGYGIIFALIFGVLGIIFSSIALRKTTREGATKKGRKLALAGMIIGIAVTGTWIIFGLLVLFYCAFIGCF